MTRRCTAHRTNGEPCKRPPIRGGTVCASHGGSAPAVRAAADRRLAEQRTTALAQQLAVQQPMHIGHVYTELLDLAAVVVSWRKVLQERLDGHDSDDEPVPDRADVVLFERALDRSLRVLEGIARLDLDARMTRISEDMGRQVAEVFRRILDRLDLTEEQWDAVSVVVPEELRRMSEEPGQ